MTEIQNQAVLDLLLERGDRGVTDQDVYPTMGIRRLGARIYDLKNGKLKGIPYVIHTKLEPNKFNSGQHARYIIDERHRGEARQPRLL